MQKFLLSLALSLAIAAWCIYDLWIASNPGSAGVRAMNYAILLFALIGACGAIMQMRRPS
jgi:hypothetical protein